MLEKMTSFHTVSGSEQAFAQWLKGELAPYADRIESDMTGNLIAWRGVAPAVGLFTHMDSVGFMVKKIEGDAVEVVTVGHPKVAQWTRVTILGQSGEIPGVLVETGAGEAKQFFVDTGSAEVTRCIRPGDLVAFAPNFTKAGDLVISKGLDNKIGCLVALEAFKRSSNVIFVGTVWEETAGQIGARTAARRLLPELKLVLVLDTTYDYNIIEQSRIKIGDGPVVCFRDDLPPSREAAEKMLATAERERIPHQVDVTGASESDSEGIVPGGVPFLSVRVPVRHTHSPSEIASAQDIKNAISLVTAYLRESEQWALPGALTR
jgi:endoglucanase